MILLIPFCFSMKGLDLGLGLELFYGSLFWALLGQVGLTQSHSGMSLASFGPNV